MTHLRQDLSYATRMLVKRPGFTAVAVITLALGIGANTVIFSVVNSILLRELPYKDPQQLTLIWTKWPQIEGAPDLPVTAPDFNDWRTQNQTFEDLAAFRSQTFNLTGEGEPELVIGVRASASLFPLLGIAPSLGRTFVPADDDLGAERVVVLSHGFWQRRFASDPDIVNRRITFNGESYTVVGVMPEGFQFPSKDGLPAGFQFPKSVDFYVPMAFTVAEAGDRGRQYLAVIGRRKADVSPEQAQADMDSVAQQIAERLSASNRNFGVTLIALKQQIVGRVRTTLLVLLGAVGFVLMIACSNVANLFLTRAAGRQKEIALRVALGASRTRLTMQLLTESVLLALVGGTVGTLLALWGIRLLIAVSPANLPRSEAISLDARVLGFTLLITVLTGIVFGLVPALRSSKLSRAGLLREGAGTPSVGNSRLRQILIVSEVAIALVLLIGAGLMIRSFIRLVNENPGLDPEGVLTVEVSLPRSRYAGPQQAEIFQQIIERLRSTPGVQAAAATYPLPLSGAEEGAGFIIEGRPRPAPGEVISAGPRWVSSDYFKAIGISLLEGRAISDTDSATSPRVLIVNEAFVRRFFPEEEPLGRRVAFERTSDGGPNWREIVGVVSDVRHSALDSNPKPEMYFPFSQRPSPFMTLVVRTSGDPMQMVAAVRSQVRAIDEAQPISNIRTMEQLLDNSISQRRFNMLVITLFGGASLALAAVGIYGVMAYSVSQRTREIGIRMALGARASAVLKLIIAQGMMLVSIGTAIGLIASFALTRVLATLLYGVSTTDPVTFLVISLLLICVAFLACYIPARRATRVEPMIALRDE